MRNSKSNSNKPGISQEGRAIVREGGRMLSYAGSLLEKYAKTATVKKVGTYVKKFGKIVVILA